MFLNINAVILVIFFATHVNTWQLPKFFRNPYCYLKECCDDGWIKFDKGKLTKSLEAQVYGQPLLETAVGALSAHFNPYFPPKKALTLSFHGMTGTGKNYVSSFIAESIYREGTRSKFVHQFIGKMHFSEESKVYEYRRNLLSWVKGNVSSCNRQLFIFDEVDKMVPGVLNAIKPLIDYRDVIEGIDFSKSVFIFLSNTGADLINEHFHDLYFKEGRNREELTMSDFENMIKRGAFNEQGWLNKGSGYFNILARRVYYSSLAGHIHNLISILGGFHQSDTIKSNLIDHYVPFLPLEEKHVIFCIKNEFYWRKVLDPKGEHIMEVLKIIEWGPDSSKKFSKTGCKRISQKVAVLVDKYYPYYDFDNLEL